VRLRVGGRSARRFESGACPSERVALHEGQGGGRGGGVLGEEKDDAGISLKKNRDLGRGGDACPGVPEEKQKKTREEETALFLSGGQGIFIRGKPGEPGRGGTGSSEGRGVEGELTQGHQKGQPCRKTARRRKGEGKVNRSEQQSSGDPRKCLSSPSN